MKPAPEPSDLTELPRWGGAGALDLWSGRVLGKCTLSGTGGALRTCFHRSGAGRPPLPAPLLGARLQGLTPSGAAVWTEAGCAS